MKKVKRVKAVECPRCTGDWMERIEQRFVNQILIKCGTCGLWYAVNLDKFTVLKVHHATVQKVLRHKTENRE